MRWKAHAGPTRARHCPSRLLPREEPNQAWQEPEERSGDARERLTQPRWRWLSAANNKKGVKIGHTVGEDGK